MLRKQELYTGEIIDYTAEGQGVARIEGCVVFVPNAVAGEVCRIQITQVGKTWAAGKIREILVRSPHRISRSCPQAKRCGGCAFQHLDYEEECRLKAERVRQALNRIGGETLDAVELLPAPACFAYRNKAQYPVSSQKGRVYAGFYQAGTHAVVACPRCEILPREADLARDAVVEYANALGLSAYDEATGKGLLRHIYVRKGWVSGQLLVCVVVCGDALPQAHTLVARLRRIPGFTTLVLSRHKKPGNTVLGDSFQTLYGPGYIEDTLCGLQFRLSPRSFYQVNHPQAEKLYQKAMELADLKSTDTVLDLYCGVGTITLAMAGRAGRVLGVELVEQAVQDAWDNARRNGVENAEFFCGDAGSATLELERRGVRPDVVVVDPPRKGLSADVIQALEAMAPNRLVYVSCDPATLARDVALLKKRGFHLEKVLALDLFPRCAHVETVIKMVRQEYEETRE